MTDHQSFLRSLDPDTRADLLRTEDAPGLRHLTGHLALIAFFGTWIAQGWLLWPVALVAQGIAICFLFTLEHEATHKTPFRTEWLNEWVGRLAGLAILQPFEWFRWFHLAHHRHTNIPGRDPELLAGGRPETRREYVLHVTGLPFWAALARVTVENAAERNAEPWVPARARPRLVLEARIMLAIYAFALASLLFTPLLFWVWFLPCLLGQPFLRLYLLAEHGRCAPVADMFRNTRTTYTNRAIRFLAWNMPYHTAHHTLPTVPFHSLPALDDAMARHEAVRTPGYAAFTADYLAHLR